MKPLGFHFYKIQSLSPSVVNDIVQQALHEDVGAGDITTDILISPQSMSEAHIVVKEKASLCGIEIVRCVFQTLDKKIKFHIAHHDGERISAGATIAVVKGSTRAILTGERVALNFLGIFTGMATITQSFVDAVKPYKVKILDTRKTPPGLRLLSKYAVACGGGLNHRLDLSTMGLIKDNHRVACRAEISITDAVRRMRDHCRRPVEVEADDLEQFEDALAAKPDVILLDNMTVSDMRRAVKMAQHLPTNMRPLLEASGGVTLKNVRQIAATGIDYISIGALTRSFKSIDVSLELASS